MVAQYLAHAKINLYLDILGKRNDGYHDIFSVTQSLELADEIKFRRDAEVRVISNCSIPPHENLVKKTAEIFQKESGVREGAVIELKKAIPIAAGLGGGSADAAATLIGLNELWRLGLPVSSLINIAERIGADVPLCFRGGTLLVQGTGENITSLPHLPPLHVVIAKPPLEILSKHAYATFDLESVPPLSSHSGILDAIKKRNVHEVGKNLANIFEKLTLKKFPEIKELKTVAIQADAIGTLMSGSGPTVFALAKSKAQAEKIFKALKRVCATVILTKNCGCGVTEIKEKNGRKEGKKAR